MTSDALPPVSAPSQLRPETVAVTVGRPARVVDAPLNTPPTFAATYVGDHDTSSGSLGYGRYGNPSWQALEEGIGALEGGRALTFSSGMAAAHAVLDLVAPGSTIVLPYNCYLGVAASIDARAARDGWTVRTVDIADTDAVLAAAVGADLVWVESPTNPTIEVADLPALGAALAGKVRLVVDNTFATPLLQQPLRTGADIVLHAVTKFIAGHSDALLGALVVRKSDEETFRLLDAVRRSRGATPGTMETYLALRGLRTLPLRLERAQFNAAVLAERLAAHPAVQRVRFPGLSDDPGHERAARTMAGFGSLISIDLADAATADAFVDAAKIWVFATSLGGVESTFERRRRWAGELPTVPDGLVRLSVGIEHVEDLWSDLCQALDSLP
ncbi:MAG: Cystathionine gamma-synthase [uncultured Friedmanniella sp.]|uniref:Cystathionine gamma-synthase n=1 Tax=uncultured Friedmanniella sp. TaxID=335381 RepID=A0A6J4LGM6_9ACTN|nr:aminotransferase class I/II-fold pyridoxal phosphate-dependent enzyme [uncultured Friedmanniella sp.]CAA9333234.1 MAG: Cystathionine gamma-synthase [uncultured Friedmanniella sp.]